MEGTASTNGTVRFASGVLAGTVSTTKGTPWASVTIACLLPGRERSTGAGAGLFAAAYGADMTGVDDEPLEVDLVGVTEVG
jgi:hypothetical protein